MYFSPKKKAGTATANKPIPLRVGANIDFSFRHAGTNLNFRGIVNAVHINRLPYSSYAPWERPRPTVEVIIHNDWNFTMGVDLRPWWKKVLDAIAPEVKYDGPTGYERPEKPTTW